MRSDGKDIGFWAIGHLVYGVAVFVASAIICTRTNNFTGWGEAVNSLMIISYFFFMGVLGLVDTKSIHRFPALNHLF